MLSFLYSCNHTTGRPVTPCCASSVAVTWCGSRADRSLNLFLGTLRSNPAFLSYSRANSVLAFLPSHSHRRIGASISFWRWRLSTLSYITHLSGICLSGVGCRLSVVGPCLYLSTSVSTPCLSGFFRYVPVCSSGLLALLLQRLFVLVSCSICISSRSNGRLSFYGVDPLLSMRFFNHP